MTKRREIRNSTAEFLIFQIEGKEQGVEVYYKDNTVWCTQKAMGMLFDCNKVLKSTIKIIPYGVPRRQWVCYLTVLRTI